MSKSGLVILNVTEGGVKDLLHLPFKSARSAAAPHYFFFEWPIANRMPVRKVNGSDG